MFTNLAILLLILTANGAPILLDKLLGHRFAWPLDGGLILGDGRRLLGGSATVRGLIAAVVLTAVLAPLLGYGAATGALIGLLAMAGDALSSLIKRRFGLEPGDRAVGLDHVPESLLPLLVVAPDLGLSWLDMVWIVAAFTAMDLVGSRLLFRFGWRKRPY